MAALNRRARRSICGWLFVVSAILLPIAWSAAAQTNPSPTANTGPLRVLDAKKYHLGTPGMAEWQEFEGQTPHGRQLDLRFTDQTNSAEQTLLIRQRDVKFNWTVELNGRRIGLLEPMEAELLTALAIPPGTLRDGENSLAIVPPKAIDDIVVGEISIDRRPLENALGEARLAIEVTDEDTKSGLPCRITVADRNGALMPLIVTPTPSTNSLAVASRTGVVYSRDGRVHIGVLPGDYTVYATRGFEYSMPTRQVTVAAGQTRQVRLQIRREVPTPGWIACDTHIHTLTYSGHGDARIDERMLTIAGEGIELAVATDHNHHTDYSEEAVKARINSHFTPVIGNEVTTKVGHFNAFPIKPGSTVVDARLPDWGSLIRAMRATPGVQVITLNHPRDDHGGFIPFSPKNFDAATGKFLHGEDFGFDALEVVTSAALQSDIMQLFHDWFALLNAGHRVAAVGSSDSHDVSRFILGQGRSYVACRDDNPGAIDINEACQSFRQGRVLVSMGLLTNMKVDDKYAVGDLATNLGEEVNVTVTVLGPSWVTADHLELFANGIKIQERDLASTTAVEKAQVTWTIQRPKQDAYLVAIATGPGVTAPSWAIPRPYQPTSKIWKPRVIGATNPVWLDCDGDGKFTALNLQK
jgi:hypothetical protein